MSKKNLFHILYQDIKRYNNIVEALNSVSFHVVFWFRLTSWIYSKNLIIRLLGIPIVIIYKFLRLCSGIQLPINTNIKSGLRFFHYNCIIIAQQCKIGENVSIHQGVTIGRIFNGSKAGVPTIGNNVVIFAGAKILGNVTIGDYSVIGANAVVTDNVPPNSVCVGIPGKVISSDSSHCFSHEYVNIFKHEK